MMRDLFEFVYGYWEAFFNLAKSFGEVMMIFVVALSSPVWIIPYAIIKNGRKSTEKEAVE